MVKKHNKYGPEWQQEIKLIVGQEIELTIKEKQKQPDGTEKEVAVTKKVNNIEHLLTEITTQKKAVEDQLDKLADQRGYKDEAKQIYKAIKELEPKVADWQAFANWYNEAHKNFLAGGTNGYGTSNVGWVKLFKDYLAKKYNVGSTATDYDNLYQGKFQAQDDNGTKNIDFRITENEAVKLITRTVHELGKIDLTKFTTYVNTKSLTDLPIITSNTLTYTKTDLINWLTHIQARAKVLVDNKIKTDGHPQKGQPANDHRVEYSFANDFTKYSKDLSDNNPLTPTANNFIHTELTEFFNLLKVLSDSAFTNHADLKDAIKEIKDGTLIVLPAETNPMGENELKELGITGYRIDTTKTGRTVNGKSTGQATNFYATDYGNKLSGDSHNGSHYRTVKYDWVNKIEVPFKDGLHGLAWLVNGFTYENYNDSKNQSKLISSFTNDPLRQLFADMRSYDNTSDTATTKGGTGTANTTNYGVFADANNDKFSYHDFPNFSVDEELRLHALTADKDGLVDEVKTGRKDLKEAERKYEEERQKLFSKEAEVNKLITDKVVELRTELKTKYKVDDTTTPNFGSGTDATDANRLKTIEHFNLQELIKNIRYLVNCDEEKPTDKANENTAWDLSKGLTDQLNSDFHSVLYWINIAPENSKEICQTDEERIALIKKGEGMFKYCNLTYYHSKFIEYEKLFKLETWQQEAKTKLKAAIDNQTPEETMNDLLFYLLIIALLYYFFIYLPSQKKNIHPNPPPKPTTQNQSTQTDPTTITAKFPSDQYEPGAVNCPGPELIGPSALNPEDQSALENTLDQLIKGMQDLNKSIK